MSNEPTDRELARLLSGRDGPSVLDREAVFEGVMAGLPAPPRRRRWLALALPLAAAVAALLAVTVRPPPDQAGTFTPRGAEEPGLGLSCVRGTAPAACGPGATLLLEVTPVAERTHFAAVARRGDGSLLWLLPEGEQPSAPQAGLLERGFVLDASDLEVFGLFTETPHTRGQLAAALEGGLESTPRVTVVRRQLPGAR
ncbi:MAG: hypothetical protein H6730_03285 [Deltaproteobacteria bacterium]|nr:hypothetical protein [Deltaproteobacteria bacterium]